MLEEMEMFLESFREQNLFADEKLDGGVSKKKRLFASINGTAKLTKL